ncbi:helix-turn-helix domain-containing protein [Moheibacter sediminis]|uniref:Plasmid maintenance system antidote protein VapI, contains XRE-type HTH domain n=1 Tax=Moheibacter sediminis TaxID=1434700 RepID=A0A1W2ALR7_9FLAO|nr:helix-turn-helix transcriptional regulator [Moheibacter sediminis]SMC61635.1 Plasmid maintenance system antidote protein VapI, contains XRE-type HTH domain [Moheibacter sediminis]
MEASKRILEILEKSGLTPSEFADKIEVQRSAISHIVSGRNKPSLEFLIKIKKVFPEIDTDWLVFGTEKKEEFEEISSENENMENSVNFHPTLFDIDEIENSEQEIQNSQEIISQNEMPVSNSSKKIKKIVFFYEDGTFDDFSQNQG